MQNLADKIFNLSLTDWLIHIQRDLYGLIFQWSNSSQMSLYMVQQHIGLGNTHANVSQTTTQGTLDGCTFLLHLSSQNTWKVFRAPHCLGHTGRCTWTSNEVGFPPPRLKDSQPYLGNPRPSWASPPPASRWSASGSRWGSVYGDSSSKLQGKGRRDGRQRKQPSQRNDTGNSHGSGTAATKPSITSKPAIAQLIKWSHRVLAAW